MKHTFIVLVKLFMWFWAWLFCVFEMNGMWRRCFTMKWTYIDIEPVLNFRHIKLQRVFLSYKVVTVSSHYLIFYHHIMQDSYLDHSIFHAGRYLDDKEICYLRTLIVRANVCSGTSYELINTGHISVQKYRHL